MAIVAQTKLGTALFTNYNATGNSDVLQRAPTHPLRISARLNTYQGANTATILIYGGEATTPTTLLATINLSTSEPEEAFTIYAPYTYVMATISAISSPACNVSVIANALEE